MTELLWDDVGERRYETGVDRGVLYLPDGRGVPWNGLTAVDEDLSDIETNAFHFDGVKYLDTRYPGDFSAVLKAFTYPDEFLEFDGFKELSYGALLGHQPVYERFGLSYRTRIGNDVDGIDHGYKIHILYNLAATPDNRSYTALSDQQNPLEFSWKITGVPEPVAGYRPTAHIILDTTRMNPYLIAKVEEILYGTGSVEGASLLPLSGMIDLINTWILIEIIDNGDGTWTATGPDELVAFLDSTTFQIISGSVVFLTADKYKISTTYDF